MNSDMNNDEHNEEERIFHEHNEWLRKAGRPPMGRDEYNERVRMVKRRRAEAPRIREEADRIRFIVWCVSSGTMEYDIDRLHGEAVALMDLMRSLYRGELIHDFDTCYEELVALR